MTDSFDAIEHVVVLMMENRSFDHMLGYLSLEGGRTDVDGLTGTEFNEYGGRQFPVHPLHTTRFPGNPGHSHDCVAEQLSDNNGGFVKDFAYHGAADPSAVMGYYNAQSLPVYDCLAREFTICDHWFASVPGPTWPNRFYSLSGNSKGEADPPPLQWKPKIGFKKVRVPGLPFRVPLPVSFKLRLPAYEMKTIFEYLDDAKVDWTYFYQDIAFLRLYKHFRTEFRKIETIQEFFQRAEEGRLPAVSWIDPDFEDIGEGNDDHPPADVVAGQNLVARIYNALLAGGNGLWTKTLLVITYDEHGGIYDHVTPPEAPDDLPDFRKYGLRVPAFLVSAWAPRRRVVKTLFDHTSVLRSILHRFCAKDGQIPSMGLRVDSAAELWPALTESIARMDATAVAVPVTRETSARVDVRNELQELLSVLRVELDEKGIPSA